MDTVRHLTPSEAAFEKWWKEYQWGQYVYEYDLARAAFFAGLELRKEHKGD